MSSSLKNKSACYKSRKSRVKASIGKGTSKNPRIVAIRSNTNMYVQVIDDVAQKTLIGIDSRKITDKKITKKQDLARALGDMIGKHLQDMKIKKAVFDRNGHLYTGRVKSLCEGIREAGVTI